MDVQFNFVDRSSGAVPVDRRSALGSYSLFRGVPRYSAHHTTSHHNQ